MKPSISKTVLVIAAHCDDETLGCGGTIRKHIEQGDLVFAIAFTDGVGSRESNNLELVTNKRLQSAFDAAKEIGFKWHTIANWPDNQLDQIPLLSLVKFIEKVKSEINPQIIYTHSKSDLNIDHRRVHEAVVTAFRPQPGEIWEEILAFEIPSSTEWGLSVFKPVITVDITKQWQKKHRALQFYDQEMRAFPHSRSYKSIEALAILRGTQCGFEQAEAFELIRKRVP